MAVAAGRAGARESQSAAPGLDQAVRRKLARLKAALRLSLLCRGGGAFAAVALGGVLVTFAADYGAYLLTFEHLTRGERLALGIVSLSALAAVAWRRIARPLMAPLPGEELALMLERRHPELGERLISALSFSRVADPERAGVSAELVGRVLAEAGEATARLKATSVIARGPVARACGTILLAAMLVLGFGISRADLFAVWFRRTVLLADDAWPRRTRLAVTNGRLIRVARGEPLTIEVAADPAFVVPDRVTLHMTFAGGSREVAEEMARAEGSPNVFVKRFDSLTEPMSFRAAGNDDRTPECTVEIDEPPYLTAVTMTVERPAYMLEPAVEVPGSAGTLHVAVGSRLRILGVATKDLARAAILLDDVEAGSCALSAVTDAEGAAGRPRSVEARLALDATQPFRPVRDLRIALTDVEGFVNSRAAQYRVALLADRPPTVELAVRGVGASVTARARVPYAIEAQDDHGLVAFVLEWGAAPAGTPRRDAVLALDPPEKRRSHEGVLDLEPLTRGVSTEEAPLNLGDTLRLLVRVRDSLPGPEGPNETASQPVALKIASEEEILAGLGETQRAAREQFDQAVPIQGEAVERSAAAVDAKTEEDVRRFVQESANLQLQIGERVTAVLGRFEEVLERMENNRIGSEAEKWHLRTRVIDPVRSLAGAALKALAADLVALRAKEDPSDIRRAMPAILEAQRAVHERMRAISAEMIKIESAQQVEREWRAILDQTQKVKNILETERRRGPKAVEQDGPAPGGEAP